MGLAQLTADIYKYNEEGYGRMKIAEMLGIPTSTVRKVLGPSRRSPTKITDELVEEMGTLRAQGCSNAEIAQKLGVCKATAVRYAGKQKDHVRAEYGSIVAHVKDTDEIKIESPKAVPLPYISTSPAIVETKETQLEFIESLTSFKAGKFRFDISNYGTQPSEYTITYEPIGTKIGTLKEEDIQCLIDALNAINFKGGKMI